MSNFEKRMERGGVFFWAVTLLCALGLYAFFFVAFALGGALT